MTTKPSQLAFICVLLVLSPCVLSSQQTAPSPQAADTTQQSASPAPHPMIAEYSPPPENARKAAEYSAAHYHHYFIDALYACLVLLVILHWRVSARYRAWAEGVSSRRFVQLILYAPAILLTIALLGLPADLWDESLQRKFGLSVQSWGSWLSDWITNQIVTLIVGTVLVWILYAVIRRSARRWWFYFWLASIPVLLILFFVQPVIIDPLFFKFTSLGSQHPDLVAAMERVVQHGGMDIPPERMFEMNASTKTTSLNAYVAGFGASKRAVVWDNTINKATTSETLFVFGHEMGHYVLLHIPKEVTIDAFILLVLLYAGYRLSHWALACCGARWGIRGLDDLASLPVLMLLLSMLAFLATPAFNSVSRYFEHEADRYGLEVIHGIVPNGSQVAAGYFEKSGEINLADPNPGPLTTIWMFDHPTRPQRVHFAATYDPWGKGDEGPRYVH